MKLFRVATTVAAVLAGSLLASATAEASAVKKKSYEVVEIDAQPVTRKKLVNKRKSVSKAKLARKYKLRKQAARLALTSHKKKARQVATSRKSAGKRRIAVAAHRKRTRSHRKLPAIARSGSTGGVVSMIKNMAPRYGVPTRFALRIALIESSYRSWVRGPGGEYGVYQLKCATARGLGFKGDCGQLLKPSVNIHFGLTHLSRALKLSGGNLKLAASKHNGGLGRKTLVGAYVARVF